MPSLPAEGKKRILETNYGSLSDAHVIPRAVGGVNISHRSKIDIIVEPEEESGEQNNSSIGWGMEGIRISDR